MRKLAVSMALSAIAFLWVLPQPAPQSLAVGTWTALIESPDGMTEDVLVEVTEDNGSYSAVIVIPDQVEFPLEDVTVDGDQLTFSWDPQVRLNCVLVRRSDGTYAGECADLLGTSGRVTMTPPGARSDHPRTSTAPDLGPLDPGQVVMGENDYVEFRVGGLPLILSSPHGGMLEPSELADRTRGYGVGDSDTQELTRLVAAALEDMTGQAPHVVISLLHRKKLDPNRAIGEAANADPGAERAWRDYHGFIEAASEQVTATWASGLYVDIHGHGHRTPWIELGYAISAADLNGSDARLEQARHTLRALAEATSTPVADLVRGPTSLGALLERRGYRTVPGPGDPGPGGADYFIGGYSSTRHGSMQNGSIDAIQIEHPKAGVREPEADRRAYARDLAEALVEFMELHYGFTLRGESAGANDGAYSRSSDARTNPSPV